MGMLKRMAQAMRRSLIFVGLLTLVLLLPVASVSAKPGDAADSVEIFRHDVFVIVGSTLRRVDDPNISTPAPDAPLFNDAGVNLGFTWGQWQAATAKATAKVKNQGSTTEIKIELEGLIPNAVYSVFYGTLNPDSENPLCPGVERTLALVATMAKEEGPDASSFTSNKEGKATYKGEVSGDLLGTANQQLFYFIIYHSDGQAYHPLPNKGEFLTQGAGCRSSFGEDAMRQLLIIQK